MVKILDFILILTNRTSFPLTSLNIFFPVWSCETAKHLTALFDSQIGSVIARRINIQTALTSCPSRSLRKERFVAYLLVSQKLLPFSHTPMLSFVQSRSKGSTVSRLVCIIYVTITPNTYCHGAGSYCVRCRTNRKKRHSLSQTAYSLRMRCKTAG